MKKYRKKPVVVEAVQWDGTNNGAQKIYDIILPGYKIRGIVLNFTLRTIKGNLYASPKDWIIKGTEGEFYICPPDIFEATYEEVKE